MDTMKAFARGEAARAAGAPGRVFDWDEAARRIVASGATIASAGLSGDWDWTGGQILANGEPIPEEDTYVFLASIWATPELSLDDHAPEPCFVMAADSDWDAHTYWPPSALAILHAGRGENDPPRSVRYLAMLNCDRQVPDEVVECEGCGDTTLPDPALDQLTLYRCPVCGARYIRLHYGACGATEFHAEWRRLKWWQRV